jgi:hypothetical protein
MIPAKKRTVGFSNPVVDDLVGVDKVDGSSGTGRTPASHDGEMNFIVGCFRTADRAFKSPVIPVR